MVCIENELTEVIPKLLKEPGIPEDFKEELEEKKDELTMYRDTLMMKVNSGKFNEEQYKNELESLKETHMNMVKSTKDKAKDSFNSFSRLFIRAQLINNEIRQTKGEDEKEVKPPPPNYYQPGGQKAAPQQQAQTQKQPVRPAQRPQQSAPKESANNIEDLFDTDGPRNGQGVLWEQLVYEEKKYHGVELITNMDCVMDELENVIPNMKKGGNDDMNDELDDKEMM